MTHPHTTLLLLILVCSLWPTDGSPQENMDSQGRQCTAESMCENNGEDYCWCKSDHTSWGYCGLVKDEMDHYGSYYGLLCYDYCAKGNEDYYWCHTAQGWDYCSPSENKDYKNKQCKEDSPCGKQGEKYNWCWLEEGGWGYCGEVMTKENHYGSYYGLVCYDYCAKRNEDYYWCHTAKGWDYCSPSENTDYMNRQCNEDSPCGNQGEKYNWCWTSDQSTYDYRGHTESEECTYHNLWDTATQGREGTDTQKDRKLIRTCYDKGNKKITTFTAKPAPHDITEGSQWRNEAENLIGQWNSENLVDQARLNLLHSDNLRIDMQGIINRNNQLYYNLQIQVNVRRRPGESTTVSQIIVPDGIPDRYIRRAFLESFRHQACVFVEVEANHNESLVLEMFNP